MGQKRGTLQISDRIDSRGGSFQFRVHGDIALRIGFHPRSLQTQTLRVGSASHRKEDFFRRNLLFTFGSLEKNCQDLSIFRPA